MLRGDIMVGLCICVFKPKTAYGLRISDGSSDVCSSDLDDLKQSRVWNMVVSYDRQSRRFGDFRQSGRAEQLQRRRAQPETVEIGGVQAGGPAGGADGGPAAAADHPAENGRAG